MIQTKAKNVSFFLIFFHSCPSKRINSTNKKKKVLGGGGMEIYRGAVEFSTCQFANINKQWEKTFSEKLLLGF